MSDLEQSTKNFCVLRLVNENLEVEVKTLMSNFEKSNTQLRSFLSGYKKLDNLLGLNMPVESMGGLGYNQTYHDTVSISNTTFVPATNQLRCVASLEPKNRGILRQTPTRQHRTNQTTNQYQQPHRFGPRFISTCSISGELDT